MAGCKAGGQCCPTDTHPKCDLRRRPRGVNEGVDQGHRLVWSAQPVGRDQRRFAAPAHHDFSKFPDGGPAIEASWSHPTLKKAIAPGVERPRPRSHFGLVFFEDSLSFRSLTSTVLMTCEKIA